MLGVVCNELLAISDIILSKKIMQKVPTLFVTSKNELNLEVRSLITIINGKLSITK